MVNLQVGKNDLSMKKLFAAVILSLMVGTAASAQDFNFGVKGGVAANWIPGTVIDGFDRPTTNVGFYGGLIGDLNFDGSVFVRLEALYARKGISTNGEFPDSKFTRNISYVQLPLLAGFKLSDDRFRIMFGPEFGFSIGDKIKCNSLLEEDLYLYGKPVPFNLALALQTTYLIAGNLGVDVKFDYGITKTFKDTPVEEKGRNMSLQIGICYIFGD